MTTRETQMVNLLIDALWEIETELSANDAKEIAGNPLLKHKQQFVERAKRRIERWKASGERM